MAGLLRETQNAWPGILGIEPHPRLGAEHLQVCVEALARHSIGGQDLQVLDGFFEYLVSKGAKGSKGQYFTPRHIVEFCVRVLKPSTSETVCDPACGSGGFLLHALKFVRHREGLSDAEAAQYCRTNIWGFDIDGRAVRVAKALMLLAGDGNANIVGVNSLLRPDLGGLFPISSEGRGRDPHEVLLTIEDVCRSRRRAHKGFDLILTNPPFAGEVRERQILDGYDLSRGRTRVERDILFIERSIGLLRPGGRLAIVLPHNKFASPAFAPVRRLTMAKARVLGVVGLGRHTFLPHTHQKASILFLQRRLNVERGRGGERMFFAISTKDGKDSKGRPLLRSGSPPGASAWHSVDHDLHRIEEAFHRFLEDRDEAGNLGSKALCSLRTATELQPDLVLAPERYDPRRSRLERVDRATRLGEFVEALRVTVNPKVQRESKRQYLVLDTSDAREGVVVCRKDAVALTDIGSTKKSVERGCVLISRLRPYLRQVAFVDACVPGWTGDVKMLCSPEFFVLRPTDGGSIAFLVPFLLSKPVQDVLAAAQEGGHHPRFNEYTLLGLPVPAALLARRDADSARVEEAIELFREYERLMARKVVQAAGALAIHAPATPC